MPFTQKLSHSCPVEGVCDGCDEHCKLGAIRYQAFADNGYGNLSHYYWPTIGAKAIMTFVAPNGATIDNIRSATTKDAALIQAIQIAKLCANYKTK